MFKTSIYVEVRSETSSKVIGRAITEDNFMTTKTSPQTNIRSTKISSLVFVMPMANTNEIRNMTDTNENMF